MENQPGTFVPIMEFENVRIQYEDSPKNAVDGVSFSVPEESIVCIVGESGSGKSTLIRSSMRLFSEKQVKETGRIHFLREDLYQMKKSRIRVLRGDKIAMVFQDAGQYLDGRRTIGYQFLESIRGHRNVTKRAAMQMAEQMLTELSFSDPERIMKSYAFELSGGMRQRVAIAMAMVMKPDLLIADEPTSALDVTIQAQVVHLMMELRERYHTSILMVTHNIGVASYMADYIAVMKAGKLMEFGPKDQVIGHPSSEYTRQLLSAVPKLHGSILC